MPANSVNVTFGANIQPLIDGVKDARTAVEAFMSAFAVEKIESFIESEAKLGAQIETTARQFGASVAQVQEYGYIARVTGGDQQSLANSFGRLSLELQQAQNPASRQALALGALGLSAKQLIGLQLPEQIARIADAFARFADGPNKAAIAQALFRNSSGELISILDGGRAGLQAYNEEAERVGAVMSGQTVAALAATDKATSQLKASVLALGGALVAAFSSTLITAANNLTTFVAAEKLAIESGAFWQRQIEGLEYALASMALSVAHVAEIARDFFKLSSDASAMDWGAFKADWGAIKADWDRGEAEQQALLKSHMDRLATIAATGAARLHAEITAAVTSDKPQAPAMDVMGRDELAAVLQNISAKVAAQDAYYTQQADRINNLAKTFQIGEAEKTAELLAQVDKRLSADKFWLEQGLALHSLTAKQREALEDEITKVIQKAALDRQKINEEAVAHYQKEWDQALGAVTSSFNSQLRGLLAGTTSWSQAWKAMLGDMIIKFIEMCEQMVAKWAAAQLAQTTATIMGTTARTAAEQSGSAASLAVTLANAIKAITIDASKVFGGVFGFLAPEMGPAAGAVAGASAATVLAEMPSMDVGGFVLRSGLAMVHQGEVIPAAKVNMPYQGGGMGGISRADLRGLFSEHRADMGQLFARHASAMSAVEDLVHRVSRKLR